MATALITGVAGFIGSHLARTLLARGERVVGIDNFDPFYDRAIKERNLSGISGDFTFAEGDICDAAFVQAICGEHRPDVIYHIAALAGVRPSIENPARYVAVNIDGLTNVLDAARGVDCSRIVFASSSSVYGNCPEAPFREDMDVSEPISPYAATKKSGELLCHAYAHLFGLAIASVRFFTVYGPSQRPDLAISKFMKLIANGETIPMFGDGSTSRDYTFVDDIIAGVTAAGAWTTEHPGTARVFNLGGSSPVSLKEMIDAIAETVGKPAKIEQLPMQPGDVDRTWADLTRSKAELGYEPTTSFREGLKRQWEAMG